MIIETMKKQKPFIRLSDPTRFSVYTMLIDMATKIAKSEGREVLDKDLETSAVKMYKETLSDITLLKQHNENTLCLEAELNIIDEFRPKFLSESQVIQLVNESSIELIKSNMGTIMKSLKAVPNMDASLLSKVLRDILK